MLVAILRELLPLLVSCSFLWFVRGPFKARGGIEECGNGLRKGDCVVIGFNAHFFSKPPEGLHETFSTTSNHPPHLGVFRPHDHDRPRMRHIGHREVSFFYFFF